MMDFIFIYITTKDEQEAQKISKHLLEKKLIACANFFPIKSMYSWKGKIQNENEFVLIVKTHDENYKKIEQEVKKIHSYKIPCITKISVLPNSQYGKWLNDQI